MANISAQASTKYTLTQEDIINGWAKVHISWPSPFNDTNYTPTWAVEDLSGTIDLSFEVGDIHNMSGSGFDAVVYLTAAIPLVQGQESVVAGTVTSPVVLQTVETTLYQVTFYYGPSGATGSGTWTPTATWEDPSGNNLSLGSPFLGPATAGDPNNLQSYSIPFFVLGGTPITISGAYSGAPFPLNLAIRVVQMPNNATIPQVGDPFVVHAMASHR